MAFLGYCPTCGAKGVTRERRPNGNDRCQNNHVYKSSTALDYPLGMQVPDRLYILAVKYSPGFDDCDEMVVCASSAKQARKIASGTGNANPPADWLNPKRTSCKQLKPSKKHGVLIQSIIHG